MEAPNIQLYDLFRRDLHLSDGKSLELMHLLNKEYNIGLKEDIAALDKKTDERFDQFRKNIDERFDQFGKNINARFENIDERFEEFGKKIDARFEKIDERFVAIEGRLHAHDKRFDALDAKIDIKTAELRSDIRGSHVDIIRWMIGLLIGILMLAITTLFRK